MDSESIKPTKLDPSSLRRELAGAQELARPMRSNWEDQHLAVFSCGVDGRVFRPRGVGRPRDRRNDEDLRDSSPLLAEISKRLLEVRDAGGRFFIRSDGAYTWDSEAEGLARFLAFPREIDSSFPRDEKQARDGAGARRTEDDRRPKANRHSGTTTGRGDHPRPSSEMWDLVDRVLGLGRSKVRALAQEGYCSIEDLKKASVRELAEVENVGETTARRLLKELGVEVPKRGRPHSTPPSSQPSRSSDRAAVSQTSVDDFQEPFKIFRNDVLERLRVKVIHVRAREIRSLLSGHEPLDAAVFENEVYRFETKTQIDERDLTGGLFNPWMNLDRDLIGELRAALTEGNATLMGNYLWGGDYRFAEHLVTDKERADVIAQAVRILNRRMMPAQKKAEEIAQLDGLGPISASGLATIYHPDHFTLYYTQPLAMMGIDIDSLGDISSWLDLLVDRLGARNGLELARFLRLVQSDGLEALLRRHHRRSR